MSLGGFVKTFVPARFRHKSQSSSPVVPEPELLVVPHLCNKDEISVDVGADQGAYAFALARASASCIAFEPRLIQAAELQERAIAAGLAVEVEPIALSDRAGVARLRILNNDRGRSTIESSNVLDDPEGSPRAEVRVPMLRLDDYALERVGFIKIDVEGHELAVLKGAEMTIRGSSPNLLVEIEERHSPGAVHEIPRLLAGLGYDGFFLMGDNVLPLAQFDPVTYQNPSNIGTWKEAWVRRGIYINNFFFLQRSKMSLLNAAVLSVRLGTRGQDEHLASVP